MPTCVIKSFTMQVRRQNLTNILLFAIMAICLYLVQRICAFEISQVPYDYVAFRDQRYPEYIIAFSTLIAVSIWYFYTQYKSKAFKPHIPLIIFFSILAIISIVLIAIFPSKFVTDIPVYESYVNEDWVKITEFVYYKTDCVIEVDIEQKFLYIIATITVFYAVYLLIWVFPRKIRYLRQLNVVMYILITFAVVAIIFSYATDIKSYAMFFEHLGDEEGPLFYGTSSSFLGNRNSFGVMMTFAVFSCLYLHHLNHRWWFWPLAIIFALQTVLIGSKTNMLICTVVLFIYFVAWMVFRFKKHLLSSLIILGVITLIIGTVATLLTIHHFNNDFMNDAYISADKMFTYFIVRSFNSPNNYSGRDAHYDKVIQLLSHGGYWAIGVGYGLFNYVFLAMEDISLVEGLNHWDKYTMTSIKSSAIVSSDSPHGSLFQLLGTGGILAVVVYVLFVAYIIFAMVRVFKKHKMTVILCGSFLLGSLMHSFTESPTLFFLSPVYIDSFIFTLFVIPILSLYYHSKHPSENREFLANYEQKDTKWAHFDKSCLIAKSIYFFLTPAVVTLCGIAPLVWKFGSEHPALTIVANSLMGAFIVLPIVFQLIFDRKTKFVDFIKNVLLPYFVEVVVLIGFIRLYAIAFGVFTLTMANLFMFVVLLSHFALFSRSKYFFAKAGIITLLLDIACNITHKYEVKYIELSDEPDSLTLEEKFFSLFVPRRFRKNETANN